MNVFHVDSFCTFIQGSFAYHIMLTPNEDIVYNTAVIVHEYSFQAVQDLWHICMKD